MRVALIFNPFKYKVHEENIRIVQKYFGMFPPLSLAWVASIVEKAGHEAIIIDARTLDLSKEEVSARLDEFNPDLLGFMMTTYMFPDTLEWIRFLKKRFKIPVIIGGYNLRIYPQESLSYPEIDFGCLKHAINTLPQLLNELESGRKNFADVVGLVYKRNGQVIINPADDEPIDFNSFPFPSRHLLPNEDYAEFPTQRKNFTVMVTSLGCPYRCNFCEAGGTPYSPRDPGLVADEIQECYTRFGIREIDFFDYEFTAIKERVRQICNEIRKRDLDIIWACRSRIDTVDQVLLSEMKRAGCRRIYFGIESGDQGILDRINKGIRLDQVRKTIKVCKDTGIQTLGFFLIGAPGETRSSVRQTIRFAKKLDLDYVQFSKCLAKPCTQLWRKMVRDSGRDYWSDWILGKEEDRALSRPWTNVSNEELDQLTRAAYIKYHSSPLRMIKSLLIIRSFPELTRKIRAFLDMLFNQEKISKKDINFRAYREVGRSGPL